MKPFPQKKKLGIWIQFQGNVLCSKGLFDACTILAPLKPFFVSKKGNSSIFRRATHSNYLREGSNQDGLNGASTVC